jgi:hypothetical protein
MPVVRRRLEGGPPLGVVAGALALLLGIGCLNLDLPSVAPTPPPPSLTVLTPQPGDTIALTSEVSVAADSVNGVSTVSVLCGPLDGGARTAYVWGGPPFKALVDFTPCVGLTEPSPGGGKPRLPLSVRALTDAGAVSEKDFNVLLDATGPAVSAAYAPTVQPNAQFEVVVSSDEALSAAPSVLLDGNAPNSVTLVPNADGGLPSYRAVFLRTPGLGTDNYPYVPNQPIPIEVLTDTDRVLRLTVDAKALNGNATHLDLGVELSRVVWDRYIPGQPASSSPINWAAEPVAFDGGLALPLATALPAGATSAWLPGTLSREDGTFLPFPTLDGGYPMGDGGYLARGINAEGQTLFARFTGNASDLLYWPSDGGFLPGSFPGPPLSTPLTAVDNLLCLPDSVTFCNDAAIEALTCFTPQLTTVSAASGVTFTGPPTPGVVAGAGGRYLSPNVGLCGSSWNLVDLSQQSVSFGPIGDPNGVARNCQIQSVSKLLAVGDGTFVVQLTSSCGLTGVPLLEYPILRVGAGSKILGAYTAPLSTPRPVQRELVAVLADKRVVTLRNQPPYTDFELWSPNPTTIDVPDINTQVAGLYDTADTALGSVLAQSTYSAVDGSFAVLLTGAPLGVGILAFGPGLRPLWFYLYPRLTNASLSRLVSQPSVPEVYLVDEANNRAVSMRVQLPPPPLLPDGGTGIPIINSFTATPAGLPPDGGTVTLAWQVAGASVLSIDQGVGLVSPASAGNTTTAVTAATTFTLSATNLLGTSTQTASVCVAGGPVTLAVTGPDTYACHDNDRATFLVTNGSCQAVSVQSVQFVGVITSGPCGPAPLSTYPPAVATVPVGQTVTVLDLVSGPFCCGSPGCPPTLICTERFDATVATSAGSLTASTSATLDLGGCNVICP